MKGGTPKLEQLLTVEHKLLLLKIAARQKQLDDAKLAAVRQDLESQNLYIRRICDFITRQAEVFHMHAQTPHEKCPASL